MYWHRYVHIQPSPACQRADLLQPSGWAARALGPHCVVHQGAKHGSLTHEDSGCKHTV
ncbi:hypothetical protein V8C26DRAFT_390138 [Trichoderma gracile]